MVKQMPRLPFQWATFVASLSLIAAAELPRWVQVDGGGWRVEPKVLSELQRALKSALSTAYEGKLRKWSSYTFQYQGKVSASGDRFVLVNALCESIESEDQMRKEWVEVFDGGTCFFRVEYDLQTKKMRNLVVNGEA